MFLMSEKLFFCFFDLDQSVALWEESFRSILVCPFRKQNLLSVKLFIHEF